MIEGLFSSHSECNYKHVGYRIRRAGLEWFVDKGGVRTEVDPGYGIRTRSLALAALRQFIWDEQDTTKPPYKGYKHDIADFYIESRGFYEAEKRKKEVKI
tara:strand:+ start:111 stop:410 length:300 start_codon:yes stop_codon:yes gene_type:complete